VVPADLPQANRDPHGAQALPSTASPRRRRPTQEAAGRRRHGPGRRPAQVSRSCRRPAPGPGRAIAALSSFVQSFHDNPRRAGWSACTPASRAGPDGSRRSCALDLFRGRWHRGSRTSGRSRGGVALTGLVMGLGSNPAHEVIKGRPGVTRRAQQRSVGRVSTTAALPFPGRHRGKPRGEADRPRPAVTDPPRPSSGHLSGGCESVPSPRRRGRAQPASATQRHQPGRERPAAVGTAPALAQVVPDGIVRRRGRIRVSGSPPLSENWSEHRSLRLRARDRQALACCRQGLSSQGHRDCHTGDGTDVAITTQAGRPPAPRPPVQWRRRPSGPGGANVIASSTVIEVPSRHGPLVRGLAQRHAQQREAPVVPAPADEWARAGTSSR